MLVTWKKYFPIKLNDIYGKLVVFDRIIALLSDWTEASGIRRVFLNAKNEGLIRAEREKSMTCMVTFECVAKAGSGQRLLKILKDLLPNTRNKKGFIDIVVHIDQDDPDRFLCVQHWVDRKSYESYVTWRKKSGDLNIFGKELGGHELAESPIIRFFDPTNA